MNWATAIEFIVILALSSCASAGVAILELSCGPNCDVVAPATLIQWTIRCRVMGDVAGLALVSVDLVQGNANPEYVGFLPADGVPLDMASFAPPLGISNPEDGVSMFGYRGTLRRASVTAPWSLIQIGGSQNTFGQSLPQPEGLATSSTVIVGVGMGPDGTVVASGQFLSPQTPGTYLFRLENASVNLLASTSPPPAKHWPVVPATVDLSNASFVINVAPLQQCAFEWRGALGLPNLGGPIRALGIRRTTAANAGSAELLAGGLFSCQPDTGADTALAKLISNSWEQRACLHWGGSLPQISTIWNNGVDTWIGGMFSDVDGIPASNVMVFHGGIWSSPAGGIMSHVVVPAVSVIGGFNGDIVVGGEFISAGGVVANNIARWDGQSWSPLGLGVSGSAPGSSFTRVHCLAENEGNLIVGGGFSTAGGVSANCVATWDGAAWHPIGDGFNGRVRALAVYQGYLVAGGSFTMSGSQPVNRIARWNGASWLPLGGGLDGSVTTLAVYNESLVVGGSFLVAGNSPASRIATWNGTEWHALGNGLDSTPNTFAVFGGELVVGKEAMAGGAAPPSGYFAIWGPACQHGDMNCDYHVNVADVSLFIVALLNPDTLTDCAAYLANTQSDNTPDGSPRINGADVQAFVDKLLEP